MTDAQVDRRHTRDATEQRILQATNRLLSGGASLAKLSVNKIVEEAGVSRATFYLHFADKRGLVERLSQIELVAFAEATDTFLANPLAGRAELEGAANQVVDLWRAHAGVLSSLIELAEYDAESRESWQALIGTIADRMVPALRERRPGLTLQQASLQAQILAWAGERSLHQLVGADSSERQARAVAEALTDVFWNVVEPASLQPR